MHIILSLFILLLPFASHAQLEALTDTLVEIADTTDAADALAKSNEKVNTAAQSGDLRATSSSLHNQARQTHKMANALGHLSGTVVDVSGVTEPLNAMADTMTYQANIHDANDAAISSSIQFGDALKKRDFSGMAHSLDSVNRNLARSSRNIGRMWGINTGSQGVYSTTLHDVSTRLYGISATQRNTRRIADSASNIRNSIATGDARGLSKGLRSLARSLDDTAKSTSKAINGSAVGKLNKQSSANSHSSGTKSSSGGKSSGNSTSSSGKSGGSSSGKTSTSSGGSGASSGGSGASSGGNSSPSSGKSSEDKKTSSNDKKGGNKQNNSNQSTQQTKKGEKKLHKKTGTIKYNTGSDDLDQLLKDVELNESVARQEVSSEISDYKSQKR